MTTQTVVFEWSTEHGACFECTRPAAFYVWPYGENGAVAMACALCAANGAADGYTVRRIVED